jgi:murein DD-endopeptidase MepM/ murein hydrolase activator NlpD
VVAFGLAGLRSITENKEKPNVIAEQTNVTQPTTVPTTQDDWDAIAQQVEAQLEEQEEEVVEVAATPAPTTPTPTTTTVKLLEKVTYTLPVKGQLYKNFSGTELVFCETMQDWRVHSGVDITVAKGEKVKTAAAGEVLDVQSDDLYGTTVIIRHNDGLMAYYCGLNTKTQVKKGDIIEDGTVLGTVDTVPCEISSPSHIHLAAKKDGEWVDPIKAMGLKLE